MRADTKGGVAAFIAEHCEESAQWAAECLGNEEKARTYRSIARLCRELEKTYDKHDEAMAKILEREQ